MLARPTHFKPAERHVAKVSWITVTLTGAAMIGVGVGSYVIGAFRAAVGIRDLC